MNILTPEQKILNDARCKAGAILKDLGLSGKQRRAWLDLRLDFTPEEIVAAAKDTAHKAVPIAGGNR